MDLSLVASCLRLAVTSLERDLSLAILVVLMSGDRTANSMLAQFAALITPPPKRKIYCFGMRIRSSDAVTYLPKVRSLRNAAIEAKTIWQKPYLLTM